MSRRRLKKPQPIQSQPETVIPGLILPPSPDVQLRLARQQVKNLHWCEAWGEAMPDVAGVKVCRALTYDLIQVLNRQLIAG